MRGQHRDLGSTQKLAFGRKGIQHHGGCVRRNRLRIQDRKDAPALRERFVDECRLDADRDAWLATLEPTPAIDAAGLVELDRASHFDTTMALGVVQAKLAFAVNLDEADAAVLDAIGRIVSTARSHGITS